MPLAGKQLNRIHETILATYSRDELKRVLRVCMNESFDAIVPNSAFSDQVFALLEWANRKGRALELVNCAYEHNATNQELRLLDAEAQAWLASEPEQKPEGIAETATGPHQVFLSYSRKDSAIMRRLLAELDRAGFAVWTDEGLEPGTPNWQRAIRNAIQRVQCMVVILTPDAEQSEWVNIEVSYALSLGRRVFPLLARGDATNAVPISLFTHQYIDVRTNWEHGLRRLMPVLHEHLGTAETTKPAGQPPMEESESAPPKPRGVRAVASKAQKTEAMRVATRKPQTVAPTPMLKKPTLDIEWITIPAGEFLMGSDKRKDWEAFDNETPQHTVHLPEYRIAKCPITNAQYLEFVRAADYRPPFHWENDNIPDGKEQHPVINISWHDACAFSVWLSKAICRIVRLPTEAEWEKAARGVDGRLWPWGNEPPTTDHCNFGRNVDDTTLVGRYPKGASPYGLLDMAGNVWEWTSTKYQPYPYSAGDGRENPEGSDPRTLRGGSFILVDYRVRCAYRYRNSPDFKLGLYGFRVVSSDS